MDASTITIICNAAVTCVLAITGVFTAYFAYKAKTNSQSALDHGIENAVKLDKVQLQTDGVNVKMAAMANKLGFAAGVKSETDKTQQGHL